MSFDDKKFGTIFPVRDGTPTGAANERQMLDSIGGSASFRTRIQKNADGSETMLRTKNGMPQFTTVAPQQAPNEPLYMESGQHYFTAPGSESPDNSKPAEWRFLDIPPVSDYLGQIAPTETSPGEQDNAPLLVDGQDSIAVVHPDKKLVAGFFPSSLFSGKIRLFLQAQYGAKENPSYGLTTDVSGTQGLLNYRYGGKEIQFGMWSHLSVGLFTAPDGTFWLLSISSGGTSNFTVFAYPLVILRRAKRLYAIYKSGAYDATNKPKIEAYLFAHSYIDLTKQILVGGFSGSSGGPLAYGWHFNTSGSEASIVVHELLGKGVSHGESLFSKTMTVSFTYNSGIFQLSSLVTNGGEWTDGAGVYNIFIPENELGSRLVRYSLAADMAFAKPMFSFSGVTVYGFYKDDTWTPITMSRDVSPGGLGESQSFSGLHISSLYAGLFPAWYYASFFNSDGWSYYYKNLSQRWTMDVSVGMLAVNGVSEFGNFVDIVETVGSPGDEGEKNNIHPGLVFSYGGGAGGTTSVAMTQDYAIVDQACVDGEFGRDDYPCAFRSATFTYKKWEYPAWKHHAWALVIPGFDCDAAYIATNTYDSPTGATTYTLRQGPGPHTAVVYGNDWKGGYPYPPTRYEYVGYNTCSQNLPFISVDHTTTPAYAEVEVLCFNSVLSGEKGTPGSSYYGLFIVDISYPYYDRGMYMRTSAGYRYIGSEGVKSPDSVGNIPFVGWA